MQQWNQGPRYAGTPHYGGAGTPNYGGPGARQGGSPNYGDGPGAMSGRTEYGMPGSATGSFGIPGSSIQTPLKSMTPGSARPMLGGMFGRARPPGAASASRTVAYFCTLIQLALFAAPVMMCVQLANDTDVVYWIGSFGKWALLVPVYVLLLHLVHVTQITANKQNGVIFWLMFLPMICLTITGSWYMVPAARIQAGLFSAECSGRGLERKADLQKAYEQAFHVYNVCTERMRQEQGLEATFRHVTLPTCKEWFQNSVGSNHSVILPRSGYSQDRIQDFHYLASVEASHVCGGFCHSGPALWTGYGQHGRAGSMCAPLVAAKFRTIKRQAEIIFWVSLINCFILLIGYLVARPMLERLCYFGDNVD